MLYEDKHFFMNNWHLKGKNFYVLIAIYLDKILSCF